jgi:hypothetical protein
VTEPQDQPAGGADLVLHIPQGGQHGGELAQRMAPQRRALALDRGTGGFVGVGDPLRDDPGAAGGGKDGDGLAADDAGGAGEQDAHGDAPLQSIESPEGEEVLLAR